jgi:hypothetical protein
MLSEFCNAPQSPYPVPSLIEQRKISDRGLLLASSPNFILESYMVIFVCLSQPGVIICLKSAKLLLFSKLTLFCFSGSMEDNAYEEFAFNTIGHLKDFLSGRGLSYTGSKQQLVSRCFVAWESKTPLKFTEQPEKQNKVYQYGKSSQI